MPGEHTTFLHWVRPARGLSPPPFCAWGGADRQRCVAARFYGRVVTGRLREAPPSVLLDDRVYQQYTGRLII